MNERESLFPSVRQKAARHIATPWWNLRFSLGMWIGGFTSARRDYPAVVFYAQKRWGYGRLRQLRIRTVCRVFGHDFAEPIETVARCKNGCGGMRRG